MTQWLKWQNDYIRYQALTAITNTQLIGWPCLYNWIESRACKGVSSIRIVNWLYHLYVIDNLYVVNVVYVIHYLHLVLRYKV